MLCRFELTPHMVTVSVLKIDVQSVPDHRQIISAVQSFKGGAALRTGQIFDDFGPWLTLSNDRQRVSRDDRHAATRRHCEQHKGGQDSSRYPAVARAALAAAKARVNQESAQNTRLTDRIIMEQLCV